MQNWKAVEELAEIRAEIARLTAREEELHAEFLEGPARVEGLLHVVEVQETYCNLFDRSRLPEEVLVNPEYYRVSHQRDVVVIPRTVDQRLRATA